MMLGDRESGFGVGALRIFAGANIRNGCSLDAATRNPGLRVTSGSRIALRFIRATSAQHFAAQSPRIPNPKPPLRNAQQGAAVIAALLVVALVAIVASTLLARQSQALTRVEATLSRAQASTYAHTGVHWARGILADDAKRNAVDHLGEAWARPLAALPVDDAVVSGRIVDAQGRFNLNNLVRNNVASPNDIQICRRLLEKLGLNPELAYAIADWIDADGDVNTAAGAEDAFYLAERDPYRAANRPLLSIDELLRVRGFTEAMVAKLRPHVTALPAITRINLNTADAVLVEALMPELDSAERQKLLRDRTVKPFERLEDIRSRYPKVPPSVINDDLDVKSQFFSVTVSISAGTRDHPVTLAAEALLRRDAATAAQGWPVIIRVQPL